MITDILKTFLQVAFVVTLFIMAFALGFHCLLGEQEVFAHAGFSLTKTLVMMLGEIDFGDMIARHVTHIGIEPTKHMPYLELTVVYFVVFIALISNHNELAC